jgi:hypothetical protein
MPAMEQPNPVDEPEKHPPEPSPRPDPDPKVIPLDEDKRIEDGIVVNET